MLALLLIGVFLPGFALAEAGPPRPVRIAVLLFEVSDLGGQLSESVKEGMGVVMAAAVEGPLVESRRFTVVTRVDLAKLLDEQALGAAGLLDSEQAREFGRIAGVDVVVTGTVSVIGDANYTVTARFIDTETGRISDSMTVTRIPGADGFAATGASFVARVLERYPLEGTIVEIDGISAFVDVGSERGLAGAGVEGVIYRVRVVAERAFPVDTGTFRVLQVASDLSLIAPALADGEELRVGDRVRFTSPVSAPKPSASGTEDAPPPSVPPTAPEEPSVPTPEPAVPAEVLLDISPSGATVLVNGVARGSSFELEPGSHVVEVRAEGYAEDRFDLSVSPGERVERRVRLTSLQARLTLLVEPADAEVRLDSVRVEGRELEVEPGQRLLVVKAAGHESQERSLELAAGQQVRVEVILTALPSVLRFVVNGVGYTVTVNGVDHGEVAELSVVPGTYLVTIGLPGTAPTPTSVSVGPGEIVEVRADVRVPATLFVHAPIGTLVRVSLGGGGPMDLASVTEDPQPYALPAGEYEVLLEAPLAAGGGWLHPTQTHQVTVRSAGDPANVFARGYLTVDAPVPYTAVVVRDETGREVYRGASGQQLELVPGVYQAEIAPEPGVLPASGVDPSNLREPRVVTVGMTIITHPGFVSGAQVRPGTVRTVRLSARGVADTESDIRVVANEVWAAFRNAKHIVGTYRRSFVGPGLLGSLSGNFNVNLNLPYGVVIRVEHLADDDFRMRVTSVFVDGVAYIVTPRGVSRELTR